MDRPPATATSQPKTFRNAIGSNAAANLQDTASGPLLEFSHLANARFGVTPMSLHYLENSRVAGA
jgi:hypothetical protein